MYSRALCRALSKARVRIGDKVRVVTEQQVFEGIILPRPAAGDASALLLKLSSGYNLGIALSDIKGLELLERPKKEEPRRFETQAPARERLPLVAFVATGGTIAARVDYRIGGVAPALSADELLACVPELKDVALIDWHCPFLLASEDITPKEWIALAKVVAKALNSDARGAVIAHGTDTMHYTSAALSFMLRGLSKPVALTGAQRSVDRGSFDGALNLLCAFRYALSDIAEVAIVMHATSSDDYCLAIRGTRARKMHTSRRDTFRPINAPPLARLWVDRVEVLSPHRRRCDEKVYADALFEKRTALLKIYPGCSPQLFEHLIDLGYRGVVLEGSGFGHAPLNTLAKELSWRSALRRAQREHIVVAMTSQCPYGSTSASVYENARQLASLGVVHCGDMLPEVAYVKLGWLLGHRLEPTQVADQMLINYAGEISERLTIENFLV